MGTTIPFVVYLDLDIMRVMKDFLPSDGYCIFAITLEDIYEEYSKRDKHDRIILGRGSGDRVGVVSLFRFNPLLDKPRAVMTEELKNSWLLETSKARKTCLLISSDHVA